ncbi:MAG: hypothetical protein ACOX52_05045 [Verrucomicrobiota bacterium]
MSESGSGSESGSQSICSEWHFALIDRSNFTAELCQHPQNRVAVPGFSCPYPIPPPFDTEADSDPDPDPASPSTFSDDL